MLVWNVYTYSWNAKSAEVYNIFLHGGFVKSCQKSLKKYGDDKDSFLKEVRNDLMYYYWAKCEWEVVIDAWPPSERLPGTKVDVYEQVMMNWHAFSEYLWENRNELKKAGKK